MCIARGTIGVHLKVIVVAVRKLNPISREYEKKKILPYFFLDTIPRDSLGYSLLIDYFKYSSTVRKL